MMSEMNLPERSVPFSSPVSLCSGCLAPNIQKQHRSWQRFKRTALKSLACRAGCFCQEASAWLSISYKEQPAQQAPYACAESRNKHRRFSSEIRAAHRQTQENDACLAQCGRAPPPAGPVRGLCRVVQPPGKPPTAPLHGHPLGPVEQASCHCQFIHVKQGAAASIALLHCDLSRALLRQTVGHSAQYQLTPLACAAELLQQASRLWPGTKHQQADGQSPIQHMNAGPHVQGEQPVN